VPNKSGNRTAWSLPDSFRINKNTTLIIPGKGETFLRNFTEFASRKTSFLTLWNAFWKTQD